MLDGHGGGDLLLLRGEYDRLCIALERAGTPEPVRELVASWENDAVRDLLVTPSRQAERLARSLGKRVQVVVEHNDARLPNAGAKMLFRNLVHLVRNAIDHGIETPEERARGGKAPVGRLLIPRSARRAPSRSRFRTTAAGSTGTASGPSPPSAGCPPPRRRSCSRRSPPTGSPRARRPARSPAAASGSARCGKRARGSAGRSTSRASPGAARPSAA